MRRFILGLALAAVGAWAPSALADDLATANQLVQNLRSGGMKHYNVGVGSRGGVITLRGNVASENQRNLALAIAQNTQGVTQVVDQMTIGAPQAAPAVQPAAATAPILAAPATTASPIAAPAAAQMPAGRAMPVGVAPSMSINRGNASPAAYQQGGGAPIPAYVPGTGGGVSPAKYDQPHLPRHAWPAYAAYPNYGAVTYPKQYSPTAWPYIGPFYPYPQVPLGWRKVTLEWDDGWWMLDFKARRH
jgi:hypothetical protein